MSTLITFLTIENNNINNYIVTLELRVTGTAFAILAMFFFNLLLTNHIKSVTPIPDKMMTMQMTVKRFIFVLLQRL